MRAVVIAATLATLAGAAPAQTYEARAIANGLARPVFVTHAPGDTDRLFIVEQRFGSTGRVRVYDLTTQSLLVTPFLSVTVSTASEQGLLGLAFHPTDPSRVFINYTRSDGDTVVAEYAVDPIDPNRVDITVPPATILVIDQTFTNHNGGWIAFGPDGYLYIANGDGGSANDPFNAGQTLSTQLGKMLRIDVDSGDGFPGDASRNYAIPTDNPLIGMLGADPSIWASGLRNPWRNDFDPDTGDLWIADVGQDVREEINVQPASSTGGENYGWRCWEGTRSTGFGGCPAGVVFPVFEYNHGSPDFGCSITGGVVVRGCRIPSLNGAFIYADFCSNRFYALRETAPGVYANQQINAAITVSGGSLSSITGFGRDGLGRAYVCTIGGDVFRFDTGDFAADINDDNAINTNDFFAFLAFYQANDPRADATGEGDINTNDFFAFLALYQAGCAG